MGLEDISKKLCRHWNFKLLLHKSFNDGTISNNYTQHSRYIEELLHLWAPTCLYKQPLNCLNIIQLVVPITKLGFYKLDFLDLKTGLILKTMVFVNKINDAIKNAACLYLLLPLEDQDQREVLIQ